MIAPASRENAEVIRLTVDIDGVGRAGDAIIHTPDHPKRSLRLCHVHPIDVARLPEIRERIAAQGD